MHKYTMWKETFWYRPVSYNHHNEVINKLNDIGFAEGCRETKINGYIYKVDFVCYINENNKKMFDVIYNTLDIIS